MGSSGEVRLHLVETNMGRLTLQPAPDYVMEMLSLPSEFLKGFEQLAAMVLQEVGDRYLYSALTPKMGRLMAADLRRAFMTKGRAITEAFPEVRVEYVPMNDPFGDGPFGRHRR
jgi:hypothetical protein